MERTIVWAVTTAAFVCVTASLVSAGIKPQAGLAYTDPGSGALIVQLLTSFGLLTAFYFSRARQWVAKRLGLRTGTAESDPGASDEKDDTAAPR